MRLSHPVARIVQKMLHKCVCFVLGCLVFLPPTSDVTFAVLVSFPLRYFNVKTQQQFVMNPPPVKKLFTIIKKMMTKLNQDISDPGKKLPVFDVGSEPYTLYSALHDRLRDLSMHSDLPSNFAVSLTLT